MQQAMSACDKAAPGSFLSILALLLCRAVSLRTKLNLAWDWWGNSAAAACASLSHASPCPLLALSHLFAGLTLLSCPVLFFSLPLLPDRTKTWFFGRDTSKP